jgi:hypothetical protein
VTKRRAPLTFENSLTVVAGVIGWPRTADIVGQAERTVRNWSEPDTTAAISLEAALKLDTAFHAAGGEGFPFFRCYRTRLDVDSLAASPGREELIVRAGKAAYESGEAIAASLAASHPAATSTDFALAERELEESIAAKTNLLTALRARHKAALDGDDDEGAPMPAGVGVAQPMTA